jgi:hypothetical protein
MSEPLRCTCMHFPVMHAGGDGKCNHGSHSKTEHGCECTRYTPMKAVPNVLLGSGSDDAAR